MKCKLKEREENIQKYLNGDMSEAEMSTFEEHFLDCHDCMEELRDSLQLIEFVQSEGNHLFPEFRSSDKLKEKRIINADIPSLIKSFRYIISSKRISFAVITVVVLLFLYMLYQSNNNVITNERIASDSIQENIRSNENMLAETAQDLYVTNFEISPNLEYLINQNFRSDHNIEIISPANESNVIDKIIFEIKNNSNEQLYLRIMDNQGNLVLSPLIKNSKCSVDVAENKLSPGLYYWKLESDEKLLYIGKFLIKK